MQLFHQAIAVNLLSDSIGESVGMNNVGVGQG